MNKTLATVASFSLLGLVYCTTAIAGLQPFYEESANEWHCGYKNNTGEIIVPIKKYEDCGGFSDGLAYVGMISKPLVEDEHVNYKYLQGFIDETGSLVIPLEHEVVDGVLNTDYKNFSEGLVAVYRNSKYGYMNKQRELVIPYKYQEANEFKDGLAIVIQNNKYGAIDQSGKTVVPIKFDYLSDYSEELALYTEKNHWNDDYRYGYVDKQGNISIKAKWNRAAVFSEGLAAVKVGDYDSGKWGIIDKTGNFIVKPQYHEAAIQTYTDAYYLDDGYYKEGRMSMYKYTDASHTHESSVIRYIFNRQGKVINEKFYDSWDAIIEEYRSLNP